MAFNYKFTSIMDVANFSTTCTLILDSISKTLLTASQSPLFATWGKNSWITTIYYRIGNGNFNVLIYDHFIMHCVEIK